MDLKIPQVADLYDYVNDAYTDSVGDDIHDVMPSLAPRFENLDKQMSSLADFAKRVQMAVEEGDDLTLFGVDYVKAHGLENKVRSLDAENDDLARVNDDLRWQVESLGSILRNKDKRMFELISLVMELHDTLGCECPPEADRLKEKVESTLHW